MGRSAASEGEGRLRVRSVGQGREPAGLDAVPERRIAASAERVLEEQNARALFTFEELHEVPGDFWWRKAP